MTRNSTEKATQGDGANRKWIVLLAAGVAAATVGFVGGWGKDGDVATNFGILAGMGIAFVGAGLVMLWITREARAIGDDPGGATKRERLQAQRSRMLWVFPIVAVIFLFQATLASIDILAGRADFKQSISVILPVLYSWVVAMMVMGWDGQTRQNRRFMEDELTLVIRARAMTAAALVLMAGLTVALGLGLWRADVGVLAIPFALTIGAATAGIRFAWLDREAGQGDGEHG